MSAPKGRVVGYAWECKEGKRVIHRSTRTWGPDPIDDKALAQRAADNHAHRNHGSKDCRDRLVRVVPIHEVAVPGPMVVDIKTEA